MTTRAAKLAHTVSVGGTFEDGVIQASEVAGISTVATTGSYTDLLNKPTIPSISGLATQTYVDSAITNLIAGAPTALDTLKEISDQLANDESAVAAIVTTLGTKASTASLSTVATTGSYTDLLNKPSFSTVATTGSYTDLLNKPTIPSISGLATTASLATVATTGNYTDLTNKPTIPSISGLATTASLAVVATTGSYTDLLNKPVTGDALPSQTGNSGKYLTTDGTSASWGIFGGSLATPVLSSPTVSNEGTTITVSISNYNASYAYVIATTGGSYTRSGSTISWTLPLVTSNTVHYMNVQATYLGSASIFATAGITVNDIPLPGDTAISITDFSFNTMNDGWSL
jgi:hypothetical protein